MLPRGLRIVEDLLPGFTAEIRADGAAHGDILDNVRWYVGSRMLRQAPTGLAAVSASRPLIEATIRRSVRKLPTVTVLEGYDVVGVSSSPDRRRVTGVRVTSVDGDVSRLLPADLVVDATGRGSRSSRWLVELGFGEVPEDKVRIDLTYASRVFAVPPEAFGKDVVISTQRRPEQPRGAVVQRLEGDRALVTLSGILGEAPPTDPDGFARYAASLSIPDTHEIILAGRPLGDPVRFRVPTYVRRRYERMADLPAGLLVVGDALCTFNPTYAQGMTVAAMNAASLSLELRHHDEPDPSRFYQAASTTLDAPWYIGVGADLAVTGVTGPVLPASPLTREYLTDLQRAAVDDSELATAFIRVAAAVDPPPALLRPEIVERVRAANAAMAT
jgi:2-polyprenyl-6-methoxyphenol hydroxylase-like FAD-dependent oxidoreductase